MNSDHWIQSPECSPLHHRTSCPAHLAPLCSACLSLMAPDKAACLSTALHISHQLQPSCTPHTHSPFTPTCRPTAPQLPPSLTWPLLQVPRYKALNIFSFPNGNKPFLTQAHLPAQVTLTPHKPPCLLFSTPSHSSSLRSRERETLPHLYRSSAKPSAEPSKGAGAARTKDS